VTLVSQRGSGRKYNGTAWERELLGGDYTNFVRFWGKIGKQEIKGLFGR